jgi:hypothetical protein
MRSCSKPSIINEHNEADYWRDWIKEYEEGKAEGELKKAREMALNLLRNNVDIKYGS